MKQCYATIYSHLPEGKWELDTFKVHGKINGVHEIQTILESFPSSSTNYYFMIEENPPIWEMKPNCTGGAVSIDLGEKIDAMPIVTEMIAHIWKMEDLPGEITGLSVDVCATGKIKAKFWLQYDRHSQKFQDWLTVKYPGKLLDYRSYHKPTIRKKILKLSTNRIDPRRNRIDLIGPVQKLLGGDICDALRGNKLRRSIVDWTKYVDYSAADQKYKEAAEFLLKLVEGAHLHETGKDDEKELLDVRTEYGMQYYICDTMRESRTEDMSELILKMAIERISHPCKSAAIDPFFHTKKWNLVKLIVVFHSCGLLNHSEFMDKYVRIFFNLLADPHLDVASVHRFTTHVYLRRNSLFPTCKECIESNQLYFSKFSFFH